MQGQARVSASQGSGPVQGSESGSVPELDAGSGSGPPKKKLKANTLRKMSMNTSSKLRFSEFPAKGYSEFPAKLSDNDNKNRSYKMFRRGPFKSYNKVT
jgi:hypothetical protein